MIIEKKVPCQFLMYYLFWNHWTIGLWLQYFSKKLKIKTFWTLRSLLWWCERGFPVTPCILSSEWWWPWKGPAHARRFDKFVLLKTTITNIETLSMSGPYSGPPSLSQERIHGVTANPHSHLSSPWKPSKTTCFDDLYSDIAYIANWNIEEQIIFMN